MKKTVMIVYTANQVQKGLDIIKKRLKDEEVMVIIALNAETHYALKDNDIPHKNVEGYFNRDTFSNLDIEAVNLANNWYKQDCFWNLVNYEDISLIEITEYEFTTFFGYVIECIKMIESIIEIEKPKEIIIFDDWSGELDSIGPKNYENVPSEATVLVGKFYAVPIKKIRLECKEIVKISNHKSAKKILKFVAKIFIRCIDLIQKRERKVKRNILCSYTYTLVKGIFSEMNNSCIIFPRLSMNSLKENFLEVFRGNISFKPLFFYHSKTASKKSEEYLNKVAKKLDIKINPPSIYYQKYNIWPTIKNKLRYVFFIYFPGLIKNIEMTKELLHKEKIELVLTSSMDVEYHRILFVVAKKSGVRTLVLHHGVIYTFTGMSPSLPVDKIAAWGPDEKRFLSSKGIDEKKIIITGPPHFDVYIKKERPSRERLCHKLRLDPDKIIIGLATHHCERWTTIANQQLIGMEWYKFFDMVIKSVKPFPNCQLIVKLHPTDEEAEIHKRMIQEVSDENISVFQKGEDLSDLLNICDIWINYPSTTGLEAMILGKSVITIVPYNKEYPNNSVLDAGLCVKSEEELKMAIEKVINNDETRKKLRKGQEKFIYEHAYKQDGQASKRVADLIEQMIEESKADRKIKS